MLRYEIMAYLLWFTIRLVAAVLVAGKPRPDTVYPVGGDLLFVVVMTLWIISILWRVLPLVSR